MKKVLLGLMLGGMYGSLFAQESQESKFDEFWNIVENCLLERKPLSILQQFVDSNKKLLADPNQLLKKNVYYGVTAGTFIRMLDSEIFTQKKEIVKIVFGNSIDLDYEYEGLTIEARVVRYFVESMTRKDVDPRFAIYAYCKRPIDSSVKYEGCDKSIDGLLNDKELFHQDEVRLLFSFDKNRFVELLRSCMIESTDLKELREFVRENEKLFPYFDLFEKDGTSLVDYVYSRNSDLFRNRDEIAKILLPNRLPAQTESDPQPSADEIEAQAIKDAQVYITCYLDVDDTLAEDQKKPAYDEMVYVIKRCREKGYPINVDRMKYNDRCSVGQAIDVLDFPELGKLKHLVAQDRWATPATDEDRKKFVKLLLGFLVDQNDEVNEQFDYYIKSMDPREGKTSMGSWKTGFTKKCGKTVYKFVKRLSPNLFPKKADIYKKVFISYTPDSSNQWNQEADKKCVGRLLVASFDNNELADLVQFAEKAYRDKYGDNTDLSALKYQAKPVDQYLKSHPNHPLSGTYSTLYSIPIKPTTHPSSGSGVSKQTEQNRKTSQPNKALLKGPDDKGSMKTALWKKLAVVGTLSCGVYALYRYGKGTHNEIGEGAHTEVA